MSSSHETKRIFSYEIVSVNGSRSGGQIWATLINSSFAKTADLLLPSRIKGLSKRPADFFGYL